MTREQFRRLVEEAIDTIPPKFAREVRNLAIVIEERAGPDVLADMEMEPDETILGLYQGVPLPERQAAHGNTLPDRSRCINAPSKRNATGTTTKSWWRLVKR